MNALKTSAALVPLIALASLAGCAIHPGPECSTSDRETACSSLVTSKALSEASGDESIYAGGVIYALPMQYLELTATRSSQTREKLAKAVTDAEATVKAAETAIAEMKKTVTDLESAVAAAAASTPPARDKLGLDLEIAKIRLLGLEQGLVKANADLVQARTELADFNPAGANQYKDTFTLAVLPPVPDRTQRYAARLRQSRFSSESFELKTTANGLLSGGTGKSEGQLDEIFTALVSAIANIQALDDSRLKFKSFSETRLVAPTPNCDAPDKTSVKVQFRIEQLANTDNVVKRALETAKLCYSLTPVGALPSARKPTSESLDGLVYPTLTTVELQLVDNQTQKAIKYFYPVIPDHSVLGVIPLTEGNFADNQYEYEFTNGLLTRYKSVTPNQLVSALGMIPAAGRALLSVPAELIKLRVDYSTQEKAYYEAQLAALQARLKIEESLRTGMPLSTEEEEKEDAE